MPRAPLLAETDVAARLAGLRGWTRDGDAISKRFTFTDFRAAVEFVMRVTGPADEQDHHPDVAIHWNEVTLRLWTHASGGVTERDFLLAATIDDLTED